MLEIKQIRLFDLCGIHYENIVIVKGINELKAFSCALLSTSICVMILKTIIIFCALYGGNILEFFFKFTSNIGLRDRSFWSLRRKSGLNKNIIIETLQIKK